MLDDSEKHASLRAEIKRTSEICWGPSGLIPAVAQQFGTGDVLMLAWMNEESLAHTLRTGYATYWSRSRRALWRKGDTSGHLQKVRELYLDCDADALLLQVEQVGDVACHTGRHSCFFERVAITADTAEEAFHGDGLSSDVLARLSARISDRLSASTQESYVAQLCSHGIDAILKKIGEEATETVMAAKDGQPDRITAEVADLWFHCLVLLEQQGLSWRDVLSELARREGVSGLVERAARRSTS